MPLTPFQTEVLAVLGPQRSDVSYLAGGAALHIGAEGERFSEDLDFRADVVDVIFAHVHILPFSALVWAVVEKNPGLNPASYLEQFRRRTLTPEDAAYLRFAGTYRVEDTALQFRRMIADADAFIAANTHREPGALLQDRRSGAFFRPQSENDWANTREHRGALGGVIAQAADLPLS